jgi:hypothetical protein
MNTSFVRAAKSSGVRDSVGEEESWSHLLW